MKSKQPTSLLQQLENEMNKLQQRVDTLEMLERYPTPLKAFIHIIETETPVEHEETKQLLTLYKNNFTEADVLIAYDIKKQIKNRVEELFTYLYGECNPILIASFAQIKKYEQQIVSKIFDLTAKDRLTTARKESLLQYFDESLIEIELIRREISNASGIKIEIPQPNKFTFSPSPSPSEHIIMKSPSPKPMASNDDDIVKEIEEKFEIKGTIVKSLMNSIRLNKMNIVFETTQIDKCTKKMFVNGIKEKKNCMIFFTLKKGTILGLFIENQLESGKKSTHGRYLMFIIENNSLIKCKNLKTSTLISLGNEDENNKQSWIEIENAFTLTQKSEGTVHTTKKLELKINEHWNEQFIVQKQSLIVPGLKCEIVKVCVCTWF